MVPSVPTFPPMVTLAPMVPLAAEKSLPMVPLATNGTIGRICNGTIGRIANARNYINISLITLTLLVEAKSIFSNECLVDFNKTGLSAALSVIIHQATHGNI